jgi:hypothetical protein
MRVAIAGSILPVDRSLAAFKAMPAIDFEVIMLFSRSHCITGTKQTPYRRPIQARLQRPLRVARSAKPKALRASWLPQSDPRLICDHRLDAGAPRCISDQPISQLNCEHRKQADEDPKKVQVCRQSGSNLSFIVSAASPRATAVFGDEVGFPFQEYRSNKAYKIEMTSMAAIPTGITGNPLSTAPQRGQTPTSVDIIAPQAGHDVILVIG